MTAPLDLPRSLVWMRAIPGGVQALCDCATVTELVIEGGVPEHFTGCEDAFICDGCGSIHWYAITRTTASEGAT